VHELQRSDLLPCIFFSFRRRECEGYALELREMDFTSAEEKALIAKVFHNAMASLDDADRELPQIRSVLPLLLRGIGVHHSGLVPIVKEVIELLFQETLVKVLFATETFALGVNMPARTVVFTSLRKFDGRERRDITSGEYIQMSGRAGRRGLDARGVSIVMVDSTSDPATCEQVLCGEPNRLVSRFRISFNLILNMTRMQSLDMEAVLANSYHQFLLQLREPELEARIAEVAARVRVATERWPPPPEPSFEDAAEFARLERLLASAHARCASLVLAGASHVLLPFLQPGRVVYVGDAENEFGWGVVLGLRLQYAPDRFVVDVLVRVAGATALSLGGKDSLWVPSGWPSAAGPPPAPPSTAQSSTSSSTTTTSSSSPPRLEVVAVQPSMLQRVSVVRMLLPYELRSSDAKRRLFADMERVLHGNPCWGLPTLHPAAHLGLAADHAAVAAATRVSQVEELLAANPLARLERGPRDAVRRAARERADLESQLAELRRRGRRAELATFQSELKSRRSVLRRMQYVDEASGALLPKGRVACEIEACDELVLTELIFDGFFSARDVPSSVALLSCLFPNERGGAGADSAQQAMAAALVPAGANEAVAQMRATARRVAEAMRGANMDVDVGDLVARVDPVLLPVAYQWCCGKSFGEICALTTLFEGNIIRTFRRMADLLQQLVLACKSLGNAELEGKFAEGARLLLRGVLGTASLYTVA
jgi:ATP-dependent RNA helicase DOB1